MPLFKSVDLTSPGPIGSTTPNTGRFTTLSVTGVLTSTSINAATAGYILNGSNASFLFNNRSRILCPSDGDIQFANNAQTASIILSVESTNILAQRNSTNAQTFRIYNTFTDASNYERGFMRWATNVFEIGAEAAGTGTQRQLRFPLGTVTASTPLSITQTWNSAGVTFTGLQLNATDTASASASLLMDLQVGGSSKFSIDKSGIITSSFGLFRQAAGNEWYYSGGWIAKVAGAQVFFVNADLSISIQAQDIKLFRDAADILAQRRTTNAQAFKLYRTFTDASNYERLGFLATNTTRYTITSENAGTGSARSLEVSFYTAASDPTSTDITSGCFSVWKNSGTGTIKLWANDGGTMKSVSLA